MAPWSTSSRSASLPPNWGTIRQAVIARDNGYCQSCGDPGNEVDHIVPGDNHSLGNLQLLCGEGTPRNCHRAKTLAEANRARPRERRGRESHPGAR
jgi:5-methylcytosine-specific restriction endonuclease McrA